MTFPKKEETTARYNRGFKKAQKSLGAEVANLKRKVESTETAVATAKSTKSAEKNRIIATRESRIGALQNEVNELHESTMAMRREVRSAWDGAARQCTWRW